MNTIEHLKKGTKFHTFHPKNYQNSTPKKRGLDIIGHLKKEIGESDLDPNPFLVLGL
jgi:hypothetical protein